MDAKWLIDPDRIRKITGSFSWIDHRLFSVVIKGAKNGRLKVYQTEVPKTGRDKGTEARW